MFLEFPEVNVKVEGMDKVILPKMVKIRQKFEDDQIDDLGAHLDKELDKLSTKGEFKDKNICITVGSRGVPGLDTMVKTLVDKLKSWGAKPFIIPAMGSHGGGTAEGQEEMIAGFGITEANMGCPIKASMEVVQVGELKDKTPVYCDKYAYESDGVVVFNKVKPHTEMRGPWESGLCKMMAIGLAKHKGASMFHMKGFPAFTEGIPELADVFMANVPIAFGVAFVQNAYDEISELEVIEKENIKQRDKELQTIAKRRIPNFKFKDLDVLVIDQIGKNISGNGMDPNIVERNFFMSFHDILNVQRIFIRGLTEGTHHNATGIGLCDVSTRKCLNQVDWETTWVNCITATAPNGGRIPVYMNNDRDALKLAIRCCVNIDYSKATVARIKDTLHTFEIEVSEALYEKIKDRDDVEKLSEPYEIEFDNEGYMI